MPTIAANTVGTVSFGGGMTIVAPGIIASGGAGTDALNSILVNYGSVFLANATAVFFLENADGRLYNEADGLIAGFHGVSISGDLGVSIRNRGEIFGIEEHGIIVQGTGNNVTIVNSGEVFGNLGGVTVSSTAATNVTIANAGTIGSDQHGIWLLNAVGAAPVITNSGTISGAVNAIFAEGGDRLDVTNTGQIIGDIRATSANQNDEVVNNGKVTGNVLLGSGNDRYTGTGTVSGTVSGEGGLDTLVGGGAADRLDGGASSDTLAGGPGNDTLTGGLNKDVMSGGAGLDDFDFNAVAATGTTGSTRDVITDFTHLTDDIDLSAIDANGGAAGNTAFSFIGNAAFTGGVRGQLRWVQQNLAGTANDKTIILGDINGNSVADFQIELAGLKMLTAADFFL